MTFPCLECDEEFPRFGAAKAHRDETGHEVGPYQGGDNHD